MDFFTRCWKSNRLNAAVRGCLFGWLFCLAGLTHAQVATEISKFRVDRADDEIHLSAQLQFELPSNVEDALLKGIPMVFVASAEVMRERWYWYDKKISSVERQLRLAYQPLTRRWRLNVASGAGASSSVGLVLNQSFDTLAQAMVAIKRFSGWKICNVSDIDPANKYKVDFRFRLDLNQLPRPFQIGAIGQADWELEASTTAPLSLEATK